MPYSGVQLQSSVSTAPTIYVMTMAAGSLIIGGTFDQVDGILANNVAAYYEGMWTDVGVGVTNSNGLVPMVMTLASDNVTGEFANCQK